jgi:hypothetical protein
MQLTGWMVCSPAEAVLKFTLGKKEIGFLWRCLAGRKIELSPLPLYANKAALILIKIQASSR